ncbi:hypothetical protein AWJ20_4303 [Sugiyamaella lignohabitans]|uniref:6-phosphogluconate dehydrogenase NADP-binding domain-containing protein n=1 Tax=Sugiyamaella lignohabitans TaxID=796027 RepID=A0A161HFU2_9ASCO|nr:uncharacterized protein AWJ20_4303 [Sugiyamaella lignohabitans]ANB11491.1 hypothetical protein AWJ20_4303 [Sugiyamaella lignohabitans]
MDLTHVQVGLGAMGSPMTKNLQEFLKENKYPSLVFYNRTYEKGKFLRDLGATQVESISDVVAKSDITFFMLSSDDAIIQAVKESVLPLGPKLKGKIIVDCATVHPDTSKLNHGLVTEQGATFISSPVFGAAPFAAAKKLIFVPAGNKEAVDKLEPFAMSMGKKIFYVGDDVTRAVAMKITGNVFIVGLMELAGEVQVLGEKVGVSPELMTEWAQEFAGPTVGLYFQKNSGGIYDPGANGTPYFTVQNGLKDSGHAISLAKEHGVKLPTLDVARQHLHEAEKLSDVKKNLDASSIYGILRTHAGLDFENDAVKKREAGENN